MIYNFNYMMGMGTFGSEELKKLQMKEKIKLHKEYVMALGLIFLSSLVITPIYLSSSNSRGEIIAVYFSSIISFLIALIFNLLYFVPSVRLEFRLILPGVLTILLPFLFWQNNDVDITQYVLFGVVNLLLGIGAYIWKSRNG